MKYIKVFFLGLVFYCLLFISCDKESTTVANPTSFSGKVIFSDTGQPFVGSIQFTGLKNRFPVSENIANKRQNLDSEGTFNLTFDANNEIGTFVITISEPPDSELNPSSIASYSCGELDCEIVVPGKVYENLIFEVTPVE